MRNRNRQSERLDEIGQEMLKVSKPQEGEIEKIIASPHLFRSVVNRINDQEASLASKPTGIALKWNWHFSLATYTLLAIFLLGAIVLTVRERKPADTPIANIPIHNEPDGIVHPFDDPSRIVSQDPTHKNDTEVQHVVFKTRPKAAEHRRQPPVEEVSEFYPLSGSVDDHEDVEQLV